MDPSPIESLALRHLPLSARIFAVHEALIRQLHSTAQHGIEGALVDNDVKFVVEVTGGRIRHDILHGRPDPESPPLPQTWTYSPSHCLHAARSFRQSPLLKCRFQRSSLHAPSPDPRTGSSCRNQR